MLITFVFSMLIEMIAGSVNQRIPSQLTENGDAKRESEVVQRYTSRYKNVHMDESERGTLVGRFAPKRTERVRTSPIRAGPTSGDEVTGGWKGLLKPNR